MDKIKALVERWRNEAQTSETVTQAILNDCAEELSQALADSAGVEVDDAMVDRACDAFLDAKRSNRTVGQKEMKAALQAALRPGG